MDGDLFLVDLGRGLGRGLVLLLVAAADEQRRRDGERHGEHAERATTQIEAGGRKAVVMESLTRGGAILGAGSSLRSVGRRRHSRPGRGVQNCPAWEVKR